MLQTNDLVHAYLKLIRRVSRALSASLYLPGAVTASLQTLLVHDGEPPPIPELANLDAAEAFRQEVERRSEDPATPASLRQIPSRLAGGWVLGIPAVDSLMLQQLVSATPAARAARWNRRHTDSTALGGRDGGAWLGMRFGRESPPEVQLVRALDFLSAAGEEKESSGWWTWLLAVGGALAWHTRWVADLLHDPVSGLPGRTELQALLEQALRGARDRGAVTGLILINPDDFGMVNESFGREAGDEVIREIGDRLRGALRRSDAVCRYGGAVFALVLVTTSPADALAVASKLQPVLTGSAYWRGKVRLSFSFGVATTDAAVPADPGEAVTTLVRRADRALNAAKLSGGRIVAWKSDTELEEVGQRDRLTGIFTASLTKDYRNMLLLWDTISIVAARANPEELVAQVAARLAHTFRPARAELYVPSEDGDGWLPWSQRADPQAVLKPDGRVAALLDEARRHRQPQKAGAPGDGKRGEEDLTTCAVPLIAGDLCIGCLHLEAPGQLRLDSSDLVFLEALARQLAVALDRARLAEQERSRQELERRRLRSELHDLRQALQHAKLVHRSPQMETVLAAARRAAATDATVLIRGESGTGKELLARTVHELSPRRKKPLVVVDCSAIATSLIDSELFGHVRGAFTGAAERAAGRLAEADGGTVLLDEIGELPLEVQGKLLRFVQEKQLMPVGSSRTRQVDARVIAVTNRDLAAEVAAGRFRQDLYYRLNVVHLVVPPLRDRPDDIGLLARYFLEQVSVQYQKAIEGLTPEAEGRLLEHRWPGNVRELQNRIMQAAIFCEGERIGPADLGLGGEPAAVARAPAAGEAAAEAARSRPSGGEAWAALRAALGRRIDATLGERTAAPPPIGRWLQEDLILAAYRVAREGGRQAAALLGIPESTFRRRLKKARREVEAGFSRRPEDWQAMRPRIADVVAAGNAGDVNLLERARDLLLAEIQVRLPGDGAAGAALMGVTEPTFRRWAAAVGGR